MNKIFNYKSGTDVYIQVNTKPLPKNVAWLPNFLFRLIKEIRVELSDRAIYITDGFCLEMRISLETNMNKYLPCVITDKEDLICMSKMAYTHLVPTFIPQIKNDDIEILLDLSNDLTTCDDINKNIFEYLDVSLYFSEINEPFRHILYQTQKVTLNNLAVDKMGGAHWTHEPSGQAKSIMFVIDNNIELDYLEIIFSNHSYAKYTYDELNQVLPYYHLGMGLPKNYLYVAWDKWCGSTTFMRYLQPVIIKICYTARNSECVIYTIQETVNWLRIYDGELYNFDNDLTFCQIKYDYEYDCKDDIIELTI